MCYTDELHVSRGAVLVAVRDYPGFIGRVTLYDAAWLGIPRLSSLLKITGHPYFVAYL
jgi:hypothetical protein